MTPRRPLQQVVDDMAAGDVLARARAEARRRPSPPAHPPGAAPAVPPPPPAGGGAVPGEEDPKANSPEDLGHGHAPARARAPRPPPALELEKVQLERDGLWVAYLRKPSGKYLMLEAPTEAEAREKARRELERAGVR